VQSHKALTEMPSRLIERSVEMKARITAVVAATVLSAIVTPSFADDAAAASAKKMFLLKDGGTLYVFEDGKTALEDKFGRAVYLKEGQLLETADGQKITANGNEVARLDSLLRQGHSGG
jgi:hypothetical protein